MSKLYIFYFLLIFICSACHSDDKIIPPNIIIIFTDDQGFEDVGCFGSPDILTPHLDKLATEGVRLTDFSVAQPVCSASRAALLTGCYPNRIGLPGALMPGSKNGLHEEEMTMAEILREVGYATGIFGKWHLGNMGPFSPVNHGFDEFYGIPYSNDMWPNHPWQGKIFNFPPLPLYKNDVVIDTIDDQSNLTRQITFESIRFIEDHKDQPFFLYVPHPQPHVPLYVSEHFQGKSERGLYGDVIMEIDWSVGQIVESLETHGLTENTIVIFTSDNGPWLSYGDHSGSALPLREGKGTTWEGGVREPFIMKYPNHLAAGTSISTHVMSIDLLPTLVRLAGAPLPEHHIDGLDIWDILTGQSNLNPHDAYYYYYGKNELCAVRQGNWKLYFPHKYRTLNGRKGGTDGLPVDYQDNVLEQAELYNLAEDIAEETNVIQEYPEITNRLRVLAEKARKDLGDDLTGEEGSGRRPAGMTD